MSSALVDRYSPAVQSIVSTNQSNFERLTQSTISTTQKRLDVDVVKQNIQRRKDISKLLALQYCHLSMIERAGQIGFGNAPLQALASAVQMEDEILHLFQIPKELLPPPKVPAVSASYKEVSSVIASQTRNDLFEAYLKSRRRIMRGSHSPSPPIVITGPNESDNNITITAPSGERQARSFERQNREKKIPQNNSTRSNMNQGASRSTSPKPPNNSKVRTQSPTSPPPSYHQSNPNRTRTKNPMDRSMSCPPPPAPAPPEYPHRPSHPRTRRGSKQNPENQKSTRIRSPAPPPKKCWI